MLPSAVQSRKGSLMSVGPTSKRKTDVPAERPPFERIALILQGGGALGAYQAGVYQALAEADLHPAGAVEARPRSQSIREHERRVRRDAQLHHVGRWGELAFVPARGRAWSRHHRPPSDAKLRRRGLGRRRSPHNPAKEGRCGPLSLEEHAITRGFCFDRNAKRFRKWRGSSSLAGSLFRSESGRLFATRPKPSTTCAVTPQEERCSFSDPRRRR